MIRYERAQLSQPQHLPDQHQAGARGDGAETLWKALPGGSGWQREGLLLKLLSNWHV